MERQGLLKRYHLSPVQHFAVSLLNDMDDLEKDRRKQWEMKCALAASGKFDEYELFKEDGLVDPEAQAKEGDLLPDVGADETVVYDLSNAEYDPEQAEEEIKRLMAELNTGMMTLPTSSMN